MIVTTTTEPKPKPAGRSVLDIDGDALAWGDRKAQLGLDLENTKAREHVALAKRGELTAALVADERAIKGARAEHAAIVAEREEIEMAIATVEARLRALESERAAAARRVVVRTALQQLDRVKVIAARVDAAWQPVHDDTVRLTQAVEDAALALKAAFPEQSFQVSRPRLTQILLWPVSDLLEVPNLFFGTDRISVEEMVSFAQTRAQLVAELAGQEEPR